ncbi:aminomethyl transferase family protein [Nonomuraea sp. MCN248]|uniref:Aminomethyl transferase family protein n=1 Tax=Nonomuraea corallina TaxID=2989783 RepID=A0ABT4SLW3_9ACTN|nr:glycine cleavage T C-terminal barrel domain-containing protein [Nonomuraea corallina]MDA0637856.1 aminomethyl transferase family protein [Nonomuraea corallina]
MVNVLAATHPEGTVHGEVGDTTVPLRFSDSPEALSEEYKALRERAAALDLGGHGLIEITGPDAIAFAQRVLARDVEYLTSDRCMMSLVLDAGGSIVDQVIAFGREDGILLESSCGAGTRLLEHLRAENDEGVEITDRADLTLIGLEGPYAWGVVGRLIDGELASLPFESVAEAVWDGVDIVFARTGFTGEYGYQMIVPRQEAARLWELCLEHARPSGQEALELAMLEVRQPMPRHEASPGASVIEIGANWLVDITKETFVGREAVLEAFESGTGRATIGFTCVTGVPTPGTRLMAGEQVIGEVVHAVHSVGLGATLGLARVDRDLAAAGLDLSVGGVGATTLTSPYIVPKSWSVPII